MYMRNHSQKILLKAKLEAKWILDSNIVNSHISGVFVNDIGVEFAQIQAPWP
jgi:hypothetical protein